MCGDVWLAAFFSSYGHFLRHLKDSPIGFFQQQLLTQGSFFPTQLAASPQPWFLWQFALDRLSQLESIISSSQTSGADLKMAAGQLSLPHRPHLAHEGAFWDPPGKHSPFSHAATTPLRSILPASVSFPPEFFLGKHGLKTNVLHCSKLSFCRETWLASWQKIKHMKAVCTLARTEAFEPMLDVL